MQGLEPVRHYLLGLMRVLAPESISERLESTSSLFLRRAWQILRVLAPEGQCLGLATKSMLIRLRQWLPDAIYIHARKHLFQ